MEKDEIQEFSKLFLKLRTKKELSQFISDILTNAEIEKVIHRWEIAKMLLEGKQYLEIERLTGASSATISKVQEAIKYGEGGFELLFERIR